MWQVTPDDYCHPTIELSREDYGDLYQVISFSEWRDPGYLYAMNARVVDVRGRKIDGVRAVKTEPGGVRVRVLHTANDGEVKTVLGVFGDRYGVVEFEAFVPGGRISFKGEESRVRLVKQRAQSLLWSEGCHAQ